MDEENETNSQLILMIWILLILVIAFGCSREEHTCPMFDYGGAYKKGQLVWADGTTSSCNIPDPEWDYQRWKTDYEAKATAKKAVCEVVLHCKNSEYAGVTIQSVKGGGNCSLGLNVDYVENAGKSICHGVNR